MKKMMPEVVVSAAFAALAAGIPWKALFAAGGLTAYSMVTRDGRRLVSHSEGTNEVFELVATNALPKDLPSVRPWTIYGVKATHTDIGLHNSQYIQRHGTVKRIEDAAKLVDADPLGDGDPAAYRYVMEGYWFWHNYPLDRGADAARRIVDTYVRRGRMGIGAACAGNHTHIYSPEELCRSAYTQRLQRERWGVAGHTMLMSDNPGVSWSIVQPYVEAGIENLLFSPNHWNPLPSTIWPCDKSVDGYTWNPDAGGGGCRCDVRWDSDLPMVFWWEAADGRSRMLVSASTQYEKGLYRFGIYPRNVKPMPEVERRTARMLERMNARYPYDVWIAACYGDDEPANDVYAKFCREWNAKWATPTFATVGDLDRPFAELRRFGDRIPVLRGEMTSGWLQHIASTPELMARKLAADRLLTAAEMKCAIASAKSGADYPAEDLRRAWWALILNDEHSYGTSGYQGRRVFETWAQHRDWIERTERTAARFAGVGVGVGVGVGGERENRWYRIEVNEKGEITSIYDKELGRELLNGIANRFLYTRDNHRTWEADPVKALGAELKQTVTLDPNEKRIYIDNEFRHARDLFNDRRYYRYGYYAFPFNVPKARFYAQLNGPVIDAFRDLTGHTSDSYCCARDWVAAENGEFGVALMQLDSALVEFGEIHPDKTSCGFGKAPESSAIYSYAFTDWLQMHNPDGDSFNPRFRYVITSYRGSWKDSHLPRVAERVVRPFTEEAEKSVGTDAPNVILTALKAAEDGNGFIARFRETEGRATRAQVRQTLLKEGRISQVNLIEEDLGGLGGLEVEFAPYEFVTVRISDGRTVAFAPPEDDGWLHTELITRPCATHGERDGQLYLEWGVLDDPALDHYELWRTDAEGGEFRKVADVKPEAPEGIPYRNTRYEERGLGTHTRYWYKVRPVFRGGRTGAFTEVFSGLTRWVSEEEKVQMKCDWEFGAFAQRYTGAQVITWKPSVFGRQEVFFMPRQQPWGEEVHGGVPVCWPWFGKPPKEGLPKHGLARYAKWEMKERLWKTGIVMTLDSSEATRKIWPHDFHLELVAKLDGDAGLVFELTETNTGREPFESAWGLHPYFLVESALAVAVDGVRQATPPVLEAVRDDGSHRRTLKDLVSGRTLEISCSDNEEWLMWNPGVERTPLCKTLAADEWKRFFCVEPCTRTPRPLAPGESRTHTVRITGVAPQADERIRAVQLDLARQMETPTFVSNYIDKVSAWGVNTLQLYLEARASTSVFSLPEGQGYPKGTLRGFVEHAAEKGVTVIPVVSLLGHAELFFKGGTIDPLSEEASGGSRWGSRSKQTFCLSNPATRDFLERHVAELCEVFTGPYFHVGFDESWNMGFCPRCRPKSAPDGGDALFAEFVTWAHGVCARNGKRMMMWDDFFGFHPAALGKVPRDIVMQHWNYTPHISSRGARFNFGGHGRTDWLALYRELGFEAVTVNWYDTENVRTLADYDRRSATKGFVFGQWEDLQLQFHGGNLPRVLARVLLDLEPSKYQAEDAFAAAVRRLFPSLDEAGVLAATAILHSQPPRTMPWKVESATGFRRGAPAFADALAVEVLKASSLHPGTGAVDADPLCERALLDDIVLRGEAGLADEAIARAAPLLTDPRRTPEDVRAAKRALAAERPRLERVIARRQEQVDKWRPGCTPDRMTVYLRDGLKCIDGALKRKEESAPADEKRLELGLTLVDYYGRPKWTVSGLFSDGWRELAKGGWKPARGEWAAFSKYVTFRAAEMPAEVKVEYDGYGAASLRYLQIEDAAGVVRPVKVLSSAGAVTGAENLLVDDMREAVFGVADAIGQIRDTSNPPPSGAVVLRLGAKASD